MFTDIDPSVLLSMILDSKVHVAMYIIWRTRITCPFHTMAFRSIGPSARELFNLRSI